MVKFKKHLPCPRCGSKDNLGLWSDGHVHCFGCGYYKGGDTTLAYVKEKVSPGARLGAILQLPQDVSTYIPREPYEWLKQALTDEEILKNRIGWSQSLEAIILPAHDKSGNLLLYQSRYFGNNKKVPKYLTKGEKDGILFTLGEHPSSRIVLVEDLLSAIVVSRVENSMPLWGATVSLGTLRKLSKQYHNLAIWLDQDKLKEAIQQIGIARLMFNNVEILTSEEDPKYQGEEELEKILGKPLDKRDQSRYNLN